ncbi:MAG: PilZ domain-containing protein [Planctomycetota bacterium]
MSPRSHDSPSDRRREERMPGGDLLAEVIVGPGRVYDARVINTSANGARLALDTREQARFPLGTLVEVRFRVLGVARPLITLAQVGNQAADSERPEVGVRFVERERFYPQLTPRLWERFNRRRRRRCSFERVRVTARVESGGRVWNERVHDLSEIGLALELERSRAEELAKYELVRALLELPSGGGPLGLAGILIHQTEFGHGTRHGLVVDPAHTADLAGQQERIAAYLAREGERSA